MRTRRALAAAVVVVCVFWCWQPNDEFAGTARAQSANGDQSAFLIRFGVALSGGERWDGSAKVDGGRLVGLDPWQFDEGDEITPENSWKCATKTDTYWYAPWERSLEGTKRIEKLSERGVLLRLVDNGTSRVSVETAQGSFSFDPAEIRWDRPKSFLGDRVEVSRVPGPSKVTADVAADDYVSAIESSAGDRWLAWLTYVTGGDRLWVRRNDEEPQPVTPAGQDLFGTALVEGTDGRIWLIWSAQKDGNFDLFASSFGGSWSTPERLTTAPGSDIYHSAARDDSGRIYLVWQSSRSGNSDTYLRVHDGTQWGAEIRASDDPANDWEPSVAAAANGEAAIVWDTYSKGNYDVVMRPFANGRLGALVNVANSPSFETRATAVYGPDKRLWLAWDEGDSGWGKDYVSGIQDSGMGLLMRRQIRVAAYANGRLEQLPGDLASSLPAEESQVFQRPKLAFDGNGNLWATFRYRTNTPVRRGGESYRTMWRHGAVSFQNGAWTPLARFPQGYGRIDPGAAFHAGREGNLRAYWVSDGRQFPNGFPGDQDIYAAAISAGPKPRQEPKLTAFEASKDVPVNVHPNEAADVARVRGYRATVAGKTYQIVRGDMHRHTDISWDGNRDGSLHDCYRYALDAAAMDYLGVADHQAGGEIEYSWWMIQKAVDLFTVPGHFAPLYGYERSRGFPSGHRNVMFAKRGIPVLPFSEAERKDNRNTGVENLYKHLRENKGIVMSHTSATGAGTDWRDSDPEVETLVEVYQGYRTNYEHEGAPRSHPTSPPHNAGFVWKAWEKGLKLGLQSSSDHVSTHASYGMIYVDEFSQEGILNGIRARRAYAATDNILVDFRVNGHLMGEAFESSELPKIEAKITGTAPIRKVEVIKNNAYIHTQQGFGAQLAFNFVDNDAEPGESYYYIRVEQEDGELAWASPVWVTYRK